MKTAPSPRPGVTVGDDLYFHHPEHGAAVGRVLAHGKHGVTLKHKETPDPLQCKWDAVLGHKKRVAQKMHIVDEGEDGVIVKDASGKHQFIAIPPEAREDKLIVKSFGHLTLVERQPLILKAGDSVNFGEMSGVIVGTPGADGAHVRCENGDTHPVAWSDMQLKKD